MIGSLGIAIFGSDQLIQKMSATKATVASVMPRGFEGVEPVLLCLCVCVCICGLFYACVFVCM